MKKIWSSVWDVSCIGGRALTQFCLTSDPTFLFFTASPRYQKVYIHNQYLINTFWMNIVSPLNNKGIKPANPEGNQPRIFIWITDAEAEAPILWPPDAKSRLIGKDPDAGKDWGQEEKGTTEDEMVGWHHRLNGHEFEQTPGDEGQGSQQCCSPWDLKELAQLNDWATTAKQQVTMSCSYCSNHPYSQPTEVGLLCRFYTDPVNCSFTGSEALRSRN